MVVNVDVGDARIAREGEVLACADVVQRRHRAPEAIRPATYATVRRRPGHLDQRVGPLLGSTPPAALVPGHTSHDQAADKVCSVLPAFAADVCTLSVLALMILRLLPAARFRQTLGYQESMGLERLAATGVPARPRSGVALPIFRRR